MTTRRPVKFASADDVVADVQRLRSVPYTRSGNWSLEQACWHLNFVTNYFMSPGPHPIPNTPPDAHQNLKSVLAGGQIPTGIRSPDPALPPEACSPDAVDSFIATMQRFKDFPGPFAPHRLFGSLTLEEGRQLTMIHCAHHFSYLVPDSELKPTA
jgi:hypothetical protein